MHQARVYQHLMRLIVRRGDVVCGLNDGASAGIDTIRDAASGTHVVRSLKACRAILDDESFLPAKIAEAVAEVGTRFGLDVDAVHTFLRENPMQLSGEVHLERRKLCLGHYAAALKHLSGRWTQIAADHFERLLEAPPRFLVADVVQPYVDRVLSETLAAQDPRGGELYGATTGDAAVIMAYGPDPRKLALKSDQARAFVDALTTRDESADARRVRASVLLTYALQGRDPIIGGLSAFMFDLRSRDAHSQALRLVGITAQELFKQTSPVNYIGRVASRSRIVEGVPIAAGDSILLMLPWANSEASDERGMAFGAGAHTCAGQAIAIAIADAFLVALRHHHPRIDWTGLRAEAAVPSVFRQYGTIA